jgi:hypothetical protein
MKPLIRIISITLLITQVNYGQSNGRITKVGTTSAAFLEIEVGSRANGMGGAFVAVADDATALYWNPAGITQLQSSEISLIHTEWLVGINYDYGAIVIPIGFNNVIGLSLMALTMGEMEVRTVEEPEGTGEMFSAVDMSASLSFARSLTDRFAIGFNAKYINQRIWHMNASSFAIDVGTIFRTQFRDMKIGMSISNFGNKMQMQGRDTQIEHDIAPEIEGNNSQISAFLKTDKWSLPLIFRVGISMDIVNNGNHRVTFSSDANHPNNNTEYINVGVEYSFNKFLFLRAGYKSLFLQDSEEGLTMGAGIVQSLRGLGEMKFDYAYADFGRLNNTQRFSLGIKF